MPKLSKKIILLLISFTILLISCSIKKVESEKINISVTLPPFADFTKQIVGDQASVNTLIPPGTNAHAFEPSPASIKSILKSDIYFKVGDIFHFEHIVFDKINTRNLNEVIDCSKNIKLLNNDPHYWLSPENVKIITQNIADVLINNYPQHKTLFRKNATQFINKLDSVDADIQNKLKSKKDKTILVYHPAWKYLLKHYGLEEIAIEHDGKTPKAKDLKEVIELAKQKGVSCIFFDPHFDDSSVSTIAKSIGLQIDSLDPLPEDYLQNLITVGNKLDKYLR